jgi:uncharacterized protein YodC (DUF2158 family)
MMEFKPGDVVVLKSGGPEMTVEEIESSGRVKVTWFGDKNQVQSSTFAPEMLEKSSSGGYLEPGLL